MTTNLGDFMTSLKAFDASIRETHADQLRGVSLDLLGRLVRRSPVKTGRFKGNWLASTSSPALGVVDRLDPVGNATIARAGAVLRRVPMFGTVYLTNNLPYARRVEDGSSRQAPAGVVKLAITELTSALR